MPSLPWRPLNAVLVWSRCGPALGTPRASDHAAKRASSTDQGSNLANQMSALPADELAARAAALEERADAPRPTSWQPKNTDHPRTIVGVMESREPGPDFGYGPKDVVVVRTPSGERWGVFLFHQVLADEFDRKRPRPGDLVAVKYEGHFDGGQGASGFERYRLEVDRGRDGESAAASTPHAAAAPVTRVCEQCDYAEPEHAAGCPNDVLPPF
jgi:hypothetical protein